MTYHLVCPSCGPVKTATIADSKASVIVYLCNDCCSVVYPKAGPAPTVKGTRAETPHRLDSWTNLRGHWRSLEKRKNAEKTVTIWLLRSMGALPLLPIVVRLTRLGPRDLDDDNLPGAFKYVRDTIAKEYGTHDGTKAPIRWEYSQRQTTTKDAARYGFVVEIESQA